AGVRGGESGPRSEREERGGGPDRATVGRAQRLGGASVGRGGPPVRTGRGRVRIERGVAAVAGASPKPADRRSASGCGAGGPPDVLRTPAGTGGDPHGRLPTQG